MAYIVASIVLRTLWALTADDSATTILVLLGVFVELYIMTIVYRFLKVVRTLTPEDRAGLIGLQEAAARGPGLFGMQ
jgi:hypothetical protein